MSLHATPRRGTAPDTPPFHERGASLPVWFLLALVVLTFCAYLPAWHGGLIWDDAQHLTNAALQPLSGLWRIWCELGATEQYYPLTHSVFWLEHRLWADTPLGYHLLNIALHSASACLLATLLWRLRVRGALLAAATAPAET